MADTSQKKTSASTRLASVGLAFVILLSTPPFVLTGRIPQIPAGHRAQYLLVRPDGGYSAGYDTGLGHAAIAEGTAANEVRGEYAGGPLRVSYTAGVRGYIPTVEVVDPYPSLPLPTYSIPIPLPLPPPPPPLPPARQPTPIETADARVLLNPDGSYAFSYRTSDHSREESADAHNNVRGTFSFVPPDDGVRRTVTYKAGAATGFVAQGAHLPPPVAPTVSVTDPTDSTPPTTPPTTDTVEPRTEDTPTTPTTEQVSGSKDASYAFAYRTPDQERAEVADSAGNVKGLFSFVAPDGVRRQVDYEAGANKGFIAKGDHLPTPPPDTNTATTEPQLEYRTPVIPSRPPTPVVHNTSPTQWNTRSWNTGSWPVTVPDPLRIDSNVGNLVVRNYLPPHPVKAGYVLDNQ